LFIIRTGLETGRGFYPETKRGWKKPPIPFYLQFPLIFRLRVLHACLIVPSAVNFSVPSLGGLCLPFTCLRNGHSQSSPIILALHQILVPVPLSSLVGRYPQLICVGLQSPSAAKTKDKKLAVTTTAIILFHFSSHPFLSRRLSTSFDAFSSYALLNLSFSIVCFFLWKIFYGKSVFNLKMRGLHWALWHFPPPVFSVRRARRN